MANYHIPITTQRKGGYARAFALTKEQRSASARHAALAKWKKYRLDKRNKS